MNLDALAQLHFLRPLWLLALLLLPALILWRARRRRAADPWRAIVDAPLLASQTVDHARAARLPDVLLALGCALAVLALAGPAFRQEPAPILRLQAPLVLALDLSPAMRAADLKPDRLTRARLKLAELVRRREDGQTALIAFSSEAFTVAPLTEDAATLDGLLAALDPSVLPVGGQRPAAALSRAQRLIEAAGAQQGEVLLITDRADAAAIAEAARLHERGLRVSVLGIGTTEGAPVPAAGGGFLTDAAGNIRLPRLDEPSLRELAAAGGGRYARLSADDRDLRSLGLEQPPVFSGALESEVEGGLRYRDEGPWLLLLLLPLAALAARRGWLLCLPLLLLGPLCAVPTSVRAAPATAPAAAVGSADAAEVGTLRQFWNDLWQRRDQQAWDALQRGAAQRAAELARDPALRGAAQYRAGDYAGALAALEGLEGAEAAYNRGNALAKLQRFEEALAAYDEALAAEPGHADAAANRAAVDDWLKRQQEQSSSSKGESKPQDRDTEDAKSESGSDPQDAPPSEPEQTPEDSKSEGADSKASDANAAQQQGSEDQAQPEQQDASQDPPDESGQETPPESADPEQQAAQEAAYREAMQEALQQAQSEAEQQPAEAVERSAEEMAEAERQQALQQLLRRVPDDPGGLLRRKFLLEYQRRQREGEP
jgi:Ca-activated chloride channel homolog